MIINRISFTFLSLFKVSIKKLEKRILVKFVKSLDSQNEYFFFSKNLIYATFVELRT